MPSCRRLALAARLEMEQPESLENGIDLIAVQGSDGDRVVGDSHHTFWSPPPFSREAVDELMLAELPERQRLWPDRGRNPRGVLNYILYGD